MKNCKFSGNEKGFSIIEVMVALVLFAIGILAVAQMQLFAIKGNQKAFDQSEAATYASNMLETIVSLPYDDSLLNPSSSPFGPVTMGINDEYDVSWTVTDNGSGSKIIQINIDWLDRGTNKNLVFDYVKSESI